MKMKAKIALFRMLKTHSKIIGNEITIRGNSMFPTLINGEKVIVDLSAKNVNVGDIILYQQYPAHLTSHRVVKIIDQKGLTFYLTKGDNNSECDPYLVSPDRIIGKIIGKKQQKTQNNYDK